MSKSKEAKTFNVKKNQRHLSKKRKLEAFLNLVRQDEETNVLEKKKSGGTFQENYQALKNELMKYQKKKSVEPSFCLNDYGTSAMIRFLPNIQKCESLMPIFIEDVHHLLLKSVLAYLSPYPLRWAKLEHPQFVSKTVFLELSGFSQSDAFYIQSNFQSKVNFNLFPYIIEVISSNAPFATEFSTYHLGSESFSSICPTNQTAKMEEVNKDSQYSISKLHLLLSPIQLAMEHYPLPHSIFQQAKSEGYCFTKETYLPVHADSPMFAIDCEMCRTVSGKPEVTRVAVVNEDLETVYHTLVKPKEEIADYITRFSGITESMLRDVTTTLEDVHDDLRRILPGDAILCGQSLNCDLHSLKLIHPYVIDTSVIFNEYGIREKKTSLKKLALRHLKEVIQDSKRGHNPIEDSIATMRLVKLKLEKCVEYGDAVLTNNSEDTVAANDVKETDILTIASEKPTLPKYTKLNSEFDDIGYFSRISKYSKKVCLIGSQNSLSNYLSESVADNVRKIIKSKNKKILKAVTDNTENFDLILSHITSDAESKSLSDLWDEIKQLYENLPSNTLFTILISGAKEEPHKNLKKNYCMITLKNDVSNPIECQKT